MTAANQAFSSRGAGADTDVTGGDTSNAPTAVAPVVGCLNITITRSAIADPPTTGDLRLGATSGSRIREPRATDQWFIRSCAPSRTQRPVATVRDRANERGPCARIRRLMAGCSWRPVGGHPGAAALLNPASRGRGGPS